MNVHLKDHYNTMWAQALSQFRKQQFQYDPLIDDPGDTRYGLALVARPSAEVRNALLDTLNELRSAAPGQYYYPASDLHLTVLSIISCYPGFRLPMIDPNEYIRLIGEVIRPVRPLRITFEGLTASPSCILVQGFPADEQLNLLRDNLRDAFQQSPLQQSIDERYRLKTAHITAIRFRQPLADPQGFVDKVTRLRDTHFGTCVIHELELAVNDWYHRKDRVQPVHTFRLDS